MKGSAATVIIVDDDASVRKALGRLVRGAGFAVETFASAESFLRSRRPPSPHCLVLDVRLPGMNGMDLQGKLSELGAGCPIVFISGHGTSQMRESALRAGAVDFLHKPFDEAALMDAIRRALQARS